MQPVAKPKTGSFELWSWFLMRLSGILLVLLAIGHMYMVHVFTRIEVVDYAFVARRWATPVFRTWDILLLLLAMVHGINGVRVIIDDHLMARPGWRLTVLSALYSLGLILTLLGIVVLMTFEPA